MSFENVKNTKPFYFQMILRVLLMCGLIIYDSDAALELG